MKQNYQLEYLLPEKVANAQKQAYAYVYPNLERAIHNQWYIFKA
jgi:hypothetical protein